MTRFSLPIAAAAIFAVSAGVASAVPATNPTTNDAVGYCNVNHIQNHNEPFNGIGHIRSEQSGQQISSQNREIMTEGTALNTLCTSTQDPS